ncbi:MAG TPA: ferredoxin reductase [Actinobacteria bacterium]|jgi:3-phenylpropionate/trans-cinnamate dioxygenase ferredoxin reductase subunit|nr:ferredoxin reductase [Actinomycetota bacterium]
MGEVIIVGGGLGALRTAESLRGAGHSGPITVVGDEPCLPYNRPPLSKDALLTGIDMSALEFRRRPSVEDITWKLGHRAIASDLSTGTVTLDDGTSLEADGLVVASGIRPRRLPLSGPEEGRFVLRTAADAEQIRSRLTPGARVLVMGAGFIGCELAATARRLGCEVAIVALDDEPMIRPLGPEVGAAMRRRHERQGVHFHLGLTVDSFQGDERVRSVRLSDGSELAADLVIEAVGSVPNVEWLEGNGLDLSDGVLVDSSMRAAHDRMPVVAVGDVARYPLALFGPTPRRIEHWNMPTETGRRAGHTLAALLAGQEPDRTPFTAMPAFWSDQYDHTLQSFGMPGLATTIEITDGSLEEPCVIEYHDDAGLVGVVGIDRTKDVLGYRARLAERSAS